jgi:hypothetical protein
MNLKAFLVGIFCLIINASYAQVRFGFQAGYTMDGWDYTVTPGNWETETKGVSTFHAGMLAQLDPHRRIRLQSSLLYSGGGTKLMHVHHSDNSSREIRLHSLKLPLVIMYRAKDRHNEKWNFGIGGGFYAAYVFSGTEKGTVQRLVAGGPPVDTYINNKVGFESNVIFNPGNTSPINVKHFDGGFVILNSIDYLGIYMFQFSLNGGLTSILPGGYSLSGNFKTFVGNISLVYMLNRKKEE